MSRADAQLQRLRAGHAPAVLAFELANRAYFAAFVSDRGDAFYHQFTERHNALLARCQAVVKIPTQSDAPSMNLGQAVALVLYEISRGGWDPAVGRYRLPAG